MKTITNSATRIRLHRYGIALTMWAGVLAASVLIAGRTSDAQIPVRTKIPASCAAFVQTYFANGIQDQSTAPFSLATNGPNQVVGYVGDNTIPPKVFKSGRTLTGVGKQYWSNQPYPKLAVPSIPPLRRI
jgi:hypothetical protein